MKVREFVEALGSWVEQSHLKQVTEVYFYSIMANEFTDIITVEELSTFCKVEKRVPVEHFLGIVSLKIADAMTIHSTIIKILNEKEI